jgi:hypothetical protein
MKGSPLHPSWSPPKDQMAHSAEWLLQRDPLWLRFSPAIGLLLLILLSVVFGMIRVVPSWKLTGTTARAEADSTSCRLDVSVAGSSLHRLSIQDDVTLLIGPSRRIRAKVTAMTREPGGAIRIGMICSEPPRTQPRTRVVLAVHDSARTVLSLILSRPKTKRPE